MRHIIKKYALWYISLGILLVIISSYLALKVDAHTSSALMREVVRGTFLILAFSVLFYLFSVKMNKKVVDSKNQYKRLFEENPNPMWVYELENLRVIAVNQAAVNTYGYSHEEFLQLSLQELRPQSEQQKLLEDVKQQAPTYSKSGTWLHKRKNGEEFWVNIFSHSTQFNKRKARLVLALDVNDRLLAQKQIMAQNEKLREIAHLQSHNLRRPVASIMGLVNLFDKHNPDNQMNSVVIEKLDIVCKELDLTIHKIVEKTYELENDGK